LWVTIVSQFFSPKEVAVAIGVSESSLKRWVDKGLIQASKTGGGHRRLALDSVLRYIREERMAMAHPEVLGLPPGTGTQTPSETAARPDFLRAMSSGDESASRRIILDLFLAGVSVSRIFDQVIAPVFHEIGDLWRCGEIEVYQERRACETCNRVLHELRRAVGLGPDEGPLALGATLDGDPYTLAVNMAELVLRDCGWRAVSLGHMLPMETLRRAIEADRPTLMWVSVSAIRDPDKFIAGFNMLYDTASASDCALVAGGQGLTADIRQMIRYTTFCDTFQHLEAFSNTVFRRPSRAEQR
jgi:excisionase family DNA binding protein